MNYYLECGASAPLFEGRLGGPLYASRGSHHKAVSSHRTPKTKTAGPANRTCGGFTLRGYQLAFLPLMPLVLAVISFAFS